MPRLALASMAVVAVCAAAFPFRAPGQLPDKPGRLIVEPFRGLPWAALEAMVGPDHPTIPPPTHPRNSHPRDRAPLEES